MAWNQAIQIADPELPIRFCISSVFLEYTCKFKTIALTIVIINMSIKQSYFFYPQIYSAQLDKQTDSPSYWHRNFGIVCEHLSHHTQLLTPDLDLNKRQLLTKTVYHFKKYLQLEPNDPDSNKIQNAIGTLTNYLDSTSSQILHLYDHSNDSHFIA